MFFISLAVPYVSDSVHCVGDGDIVRLCVSNERHCYSSRHWCNTSLYLQSLSGFVQVKAAVGFVLSHQMRKKGHLEESFCLSQVSTI